MSTTNQRLARNNLCAMFQDMIRDDEGRIRYYADKDCDDSAEFYGERVRLLTAIITCLQC